MYIYVMPKHILPQIKEGDLEVMEKLLSSRQIKHKYAVRVQTVLNRARGHSSGGIALILGISINSINQHVKRYNEGGVEALLYDKSRKPGIAPIPQETKDKLVRFVCCEKPKDATHWSTRELAKRFGISHTAVNTILNDCDLKPHRVKRFKFSTDKDFDIKLADVVGLYLNPPENSIVFCVDEKSQIQALERSSPILPLRPGIPERQTHDYYRHGTTTLFAALDVVSGQVIGKCKRSHKSVDYVDFLKTLDREAPKGKVLHIIADNYSAHKTKIVKEYLAENTERFVEHFIPTHSSWLNLIERWFAEITNKRIRRESWNSLRELENAIRNYIIAWNKKGKCFRWTKTADEIQKSIKKAKNGLLQMYFTGH
jgi:transposase